MYGRTMAQEIALEGRRLLTRHYYGDGRWGWRTRSEFDSERWRDWRVVKHRPKATTWARSQGPLARKVHAVRYSLVATHRDGTEVHLTVWWCGGQSHSAPLPESHPTVVCGGCHARLSGERDVVLEGVS